MVGGGPKEGGTEAIDETGTVTTPADSAVEVPKTITPSRLTKERIHA
jgi:hypothetical protein